MESFRPPNPSRLTVSTKRHLDLATEKFALKHNVRDERPPSQRLRPLGPFSASISRRCVANDNCWPVGSHVRAVLGMSVCRIEMTQTVQRWHAKIWIQFGLAHQFICAEAFRNRHCTLRSAWQKRLVVAGAKQPERSSAHIQEMSFAPDRSDWSRSRGRENASELCNQHRISQRNSLGHTDRHGWRG